MRPTTLTIQESAARVDPKTNNKNKASTSPLTSILKPSVVGTHKDLHPQASHCQVQVTGRNKDEAASRAYPGCLCRLLLFSAAGNQALKGGTDQQVLSWTSACSVTDTAKCRVQNGCQHLEDEQRHCHPRLASPAGPVNRFLV